MNSSSECMCCNQEINGLCVKVRTPCDFRTLLLNIQVRICFRAPYSTVTVTPYDEVSQRLQTQAPKLCY